MTDPRGGNSINPHTQKQKAVLRDHPVDHLYKKYNNKKTFMRGREKPDLFPKMLLLLDAAVLSPCEIPLREI